MASLMLTEALSAPDAVARFLAADPAFWAEFAARLRAAKPRAAITIARGSSDHAASYLGYLTAIRIGIPVASLPMSVITLHHATLRAERLLAVAISQSGQSPDVISSLRALRNAGAITAALVNDPTSPLAAAARWCFDMGAGPERSVAATKSCIASLVAAARLIGVWQNNTAFIAALDGLPDHLSRAARSDWSAALPMLAPATRAFVIGRGLGLAIAQETALKLKETSGLHAEAFSSAELRHGPMALVGPTEPVLVFALPGPALQELVALAADLRERGGIVLLVAPDGVVGRDVTVPETGHPDLDPIVALQAFYPFAAALAEARGLDPDAPPHLQKVTRTV